MSRSKKGAKAPGWDYWGKRPLDKNSPVPGTKGKRIGVKRERSALKRDTTKKVRQTELE